MLARSESRYCECHSGQPIAADPGARGKTGRFTRPILEVERDPYSTEAMCQLRESIETDIRPRERHVMYANQIEKRRRAVLASLLCLAGIEASARRVAVTLPYDQTSTSSFMYFGATDGVKNGPLNTKTIEPGKAQLCVVTTYDHDAYGSKLTASTANLVRLANPQFTSSSTRLSSKLTRSSCGRCQV